MWKHCWTVILLLAGTQASSQVPFIKGRQEIAISYGYGTYEQTKNGWGTFPYKTASMGADGNLSRDIAESTFGIYGQPVRYNDKQYAGAAFVNYYFNPSWRFSVGIGSGLDMTRSSFTTPDTTPGAKRELKVGTFSRKAFTIAPELRISYNRSSMIRCYALLGLGLTQWWERIEAETGAPKLKRTRTMSDNYFSFQFTPFGIRVGKKLSGFAEAGYGYKGILRLGASYKF